MKKINNEKIEIQWFIVMKLPIIFDKNQMVSSLSSIGLRPSLRDLI